MYIQNKPRKINLGKTFTISPQMLLVHVASNGFKTKEDRNPFPTFNHIQVNQTTIEYCLCIDSMKLANANVDLLASSNTSCMILIMPQLDVLD